ncbi:MAG: dihydroorotase [Bacteroidales bacterium]|nr:dihydroorotase [Bacteroidales bacterium]
MGDKWHIINANIVNEGEEFRGEIYIKDGVIEKILHGKAAEGDKMAPGTGNYVVFDAENRYVLPGVIDDQVHFREPGLTHKGDIYSESRAAVAGGTTSFMDMPNNKPPILTLELLEKKYKLAAEKSLANYSFYMGASNENAAEALKADPASVCGIKIFLGSSTGNMLVDNINTLNTLFSKSRTLIAVHCEDEGIILRNTEIFREKYGAKTPMEAHPLIRSSDACYKSTKMAVKLASIYNTRLHVLHVSTARELELFDASRPPERKKITAEVCVHHLWFNSSDYARYGSKIKWNPAIKTKEDQEALFNGLLSNKLDMVATDHAPHTLEEKSATYFRCPSGGPMVQHSLQAMLEFYHRGKISLAKIVEKMSHAPAQCFNIEKRGYIREGYKADLTVVDLNRKTEVNGNTILYKCGWSPFEGYVFSSSVTHTFVNGHLAWNDGKFDESETGERLLFNR